MKMDLKQIQELIRFVSKSGVSEVELQQDEFRIVIKTGAGEHAAAPQQGMPVYYSAPAQMPQMPSAPQAPAAAPSAPAAAPEAQAPAGELIKSPMIGTFYRKPGPDKDAFVKVGDVVQKGQVVCIIEAMKLFNEIESEVAGRVVEVLVDDMKPVEYDQPLFRVEPA